MNGSAHEHAWTRVYRARGRFAHIRELIYSAHPHAPASWDREEGWRGTGSHQEYERAAAMPLCEICALIKTHYDHGEKESS